MRRETDAKVNLSEAVSIHASVKDATGADEILDSSCVFQSTHL